MPDKSDSRSAGKHATVGFVLSLRFKNRRAESEANVKPEERYPRRRKSKAERLYLIAAIAAAVVAIVFIAIESREIEPPGPPQIGTDATKVPSPE
ncbi:hypothetical protein [Fulvimarina sp. MAC8]|uniref:hypothetical protein n=1 Tax=Fulvimarina sp. MAC8 TaxID=3162874 RepID=UPI0032EB6A05